MDGSGGWDGERLRVFWHLNMDASGRLAEEATTVLILRGLSGAECSRPREPQGQLSLGSKSICIFQEGKQVRCGWRDKLGARNSTRGKKRMEIE